MSSSSSKPSSSSNEQPLRELFPPIEPYDSGFLKVDDIHELYYEVSGCKSGSEKNTVIVVHGGPGGGCPPFYRQYFDSKSYRIILFDQRGAGKSKPMACLENNTTQHLIEDIVKIRRHLKIEDKEKIIVFGGSWGSTLSLAYAETYPEQVKALILRGIFTLRREELIWFYQKGASFIFPDAWEKYLEPIPLVERGDLMSAYYRRLTSKDEKTRLEAAKAWTLWEMSTSKLVNDNEKAIEKAINPSFCLPFARIECHYFVNGGFFETDGQLIDNAAILKDIPCYIVHGRYDVVCPIKNAFDLKKNYPTAELEVVTTGHSMSEKLIASKLIYATDKFKNL